MVGRAHLLLRGGRGLDARLHALLQHRARRHRLQPVPIHPAPASIAFAFAKHFMEPSTIPRRAPEQQPTKNNNKNHIKSASPGTSHGDGQGPRASCNSRCSCLVGTFGSEHDARATKTLTASTTPTGGGGRAMHLGSTCTALVGERVSAPAGWSWRTKLLHTQLSLGEATTSRVLRMRVTGTGRQCFCCISFIR